MTGITTGMMIVRRNFYYKDNDGILEMMKESCDFVQICMDRKRYKEGFEVGRQLLAMEILCKDESGDIELSMEDMVYRTAFAL